MTNAKSFQLIGIVSWLVCAVFFCYEFLLRTVLGTFQAPIVSDLLLTPISFALLSSTAYLVVYSAMQVPVGLIADRFGLKKSLMIGTLLCAVSTLAFAFTYQFKTAVGARMLMGLGSSFGFICVLMAVYDWMPKKHYGLFIGLSQFIGTIGPIAAAGPLDSIAASGDVHWRTIFIALSGVGLFLFVLAVFFVRNNTQCTEGFRIILRHTPIMKALKTLFSQKQAWYIALFSAAVYFPLEYLSENEGKNFLVLKGFTPLYAAYMITLGWFGYAIGCPLLGYISDRVKRRKTVLNFAAVLGLND